MTILTRQPLWLALAAAMLTLPSAQVFAQDDDEAKAAVKEEAEELDAVVVTGSRIRRAGFDTLEPAVTVGEEYIKTRALTNVADALNEIPGFGAGVTPEGGQNAFGANVNFVNRFGLGTARTLTLVNGRRFVTSNPLTQFTGAAPGGQVDLNAVPSQLIDRVENLAVGGAPTYGSDAIAGTVNVILKTDYEGAEIASTYGLTDFSGNERFNLNGIWGKNFADGRGNMTFSASYDKSDGVLQSERDLFRRTLLNTTNPRDTVAASQPGRTLNDGRVFGTPFNINNNPSTNPLCSSPAAAAAVGATCYDGIPDAVLIRDRRIYALTFGGVVLPATGALNQANGLLRGFGADSRTYLQFDRNGNLVSYDPGIPFNATDASGGDGLNLAETGQIISDLERQTLNATGHFQLTDSMRLFWEGTYFSSESAEIVDQPVFNATTFGGPTGTAGISGAIVFSATDPRLTPQARARRAELGQTSFRLSRASRDLVINNSSNESYIARGVVGLDGEFEALDRSFYWETSVNYGVNKADNFQNVLNQQNFINAINVRTDANGRIVCDPAGTIVAVVAPRADANCVPLDIFGEGRASAAARDYVTGQAVTKTQQEQTIFNANMGFAAFETWAGTVDMNVGYEYREEDGEFNPNEFQIAGLGRSVAFFPLSEGYHTNEFFGEAIVPLVSPDWDFVGLKKFDLTLKGRRVDNTVNGEFDTWTVGFQYRPFDTFEIRGNKTRSLRAPAIVELFLPVSSSFAAFPDPCDSRNINGGTRPATRRANCEALFRSLNITQPFTSNAVSATVPQVSSGDPNLQNEQSDAKTIGFVWQPEVIDGLRVAMDYYEINITNVIANLGAAAIATGCYDNLSFNAADPRNGNSFCSRINRDASGQLVETIGANGVRTPALRAGFVNGGFLDFQGISMDALYNWEISDSDSLQFTFIGFNTDKLANSTNAIVTDVIDGEIGTSERQYQFGVGWVHNNWGVQAQANYLGSAVFDVNNIESVRDQLRVPSYKNYNLSGYYQVNDNLALRAAITNVTDKEPPFGTVGIGTYDILGRRYAVTAEYRF